MNYLLTLVLVLSYTTNWAQTSNGDAILGVWKTGEGNGHVEIYKNADKYQGRIVWLKEPLDEKTGKPKTDIQHPDKVNHARPILGLINLWGFIYKGKAYENGRVYDPKNGKEYKCVMTMKDTNTLDVRGYVGITLIGRTDTWTRVK